MEITIFDKDVKVLYIQATSFPEGILTAHQTLHARVPYSKERKYFGISRPENGGEIVYKAATEETFQGEAEQYDCKTLILKKGRYTSILLKDYHKDLSSIQHTFNKLLAQPGLDPNGYCVELYPNEKDMICMIRLEK